MKALWFLIPSLAVGGFVAWAVWTAFKVLQAASGGILPT
ncbi:hypothetical protein [Bordetella phage CN2]|uniref:Uncharacterized protein n=1 Tax=Bordetella phage CN2 TaxID=1916124 RepID=A0A2D0W9E5_9CAUD|nr:hypothetical protein HOS30_gp35 [Bordetella phage CN2]APL99253.1 hypothetical protein [Bordetella phage CN2]